MLNSFKWYRRLCGGVWYIYRIIEHNLYNPHKYDILGFIFSRYNNLDKVDKCEETQLWDIENYNKKK
jgi:hypothetical protein